MGSAPHTATGPLPAWTGPESVKKACPPSPFLPQTTTGVPGLALTAQGCQARTPGCSQGPCPQSSCPAQGGCRWPEPQPAPPCTLIPASARQSSPRARFPEMKRKKKLRISPRNSLQPRWHSRSLGAAFQAGPGASLHPAIPGPGPVSCPCSRSATPPALSLLCLPLPNWTLGACFSRTLSLSLFWSASPSLSLSFSPMGLILSLGSSGLSTLPALLAFFRPSSRGQLPPAAPVPTQARPGPFTLCLALGPQDPKITLLEAEAPAASWAESGVGLAPELPTPMRRDHWCDFWVRV